VAAQLIVEIAPVAGNVTTGGRVVVDTLGAVAYAYL
jgi:hypothetical protein